MPQFDRDSAKRISNVTRRIERQPINTLKQKTRRTPQNDSKCLAYKYRIVLLGEPSAGDFKLAFTWNNDAVGTSGVEEITVNWNTTVTQFETLLAGLDGVDDPDGINGNFARENGVSAIGEDFPLGTMTFRMIGNGAGGRLLELTVSDNNLTGGVNTRIRIEPVCC